MRTLALSIAVAAIAFWPIVPDADAQTTDKPAAAIATAATTTQVTGLQAPGLNPAPSNQTDEAAIRAVDDAYLQAFNKHDAQAMAAAWSPDAIYLNRSNGVEVVGREAIAKQFVAYFKEQPQVTMELTVGAIQFVSPNVAVETGTAKAHEAKGEIVDTEYSAVYVRRDGKWLLDRVTDVDKPAPQPSHYEQLKPLEWMIGKWVDKDDNIDVETECKWTKNQSFITRSFSVSVHDHIVTSGMQIIGWDAASKSIRSWTFDSGGAYAEATWTNKGDKWYIQNHGVLADGRKASMTNVIRKINNDSFTWQTVERCEGAELLPNAGEVLIVRQTPDE